MNQPPDLPEVPPEPHPRAPRWVPDVVLSIVMVVAAFVPSPVAEFSPSDSVALVLVLLPILILPWRRKWPLQTLILLLVIFGAAAANGTLSPGVGIAVGAAMFQVTIQGPQLRGLVIGACAVVAVMLLTLPASIGSIFDPRVVQFGLIVAFAAAAGDGTRSRRAYIAAINERAERAIQTRESEARRRVSEERLRIARDLHDTVAHQIAVISLNAGVASSAVDTRPQKAKEALGTIRTAARTVLGEIGDLMAMLRADDNGDADMSPQAGLDRLDELVARFVRSGLEVHTRVEGDLDRVSGAVSLVAYRVAQEALTNAHKHGAEHCAHVLVHVDREAVTVTVSNPMKSGTPSQESSNPGFGLVGLRERVSSVRGTVQAGPSGARWKVVAHIPLAKEGSS